MRKRRLPSVLRDVGAPRSPRATNKETPAEHPLVELQHLAGNRAVSRLLLQRDTESGEKPSVKEQAERYIREQMARTDRLITRALENIENNLLPDERETRLPLVQSVKNIHAATGVLTLSMIQTLQNAIKPVRVADYIEQQFRFLWNDVKDKQEMLEALADDPVEWYLNRLKRLSGH